MAEALVVGRKRREVLVGTSCPSPAGEKWNLRVNICGVFYKKMVVGEGLLVAVLLALRVVACGNAFSLRSNRTLVEASHPSPVGEKWNLRVNICGVFYKKMVVGEGLLVAVLLALRVVACGNAFSLRSNRTLVEASHPSPAGEKWNLNVKICGVLSESDGGGGRIRTFEVDDGRFTVCSLWPLGNPTRGKIKLWNSRKSSGGGRRIIRRFTSHPSPVDINISQFIRVCYSAVAKVVVGEGFEPSKSMTADLQSAPFGRSGTPPIYWPAPCGSGAHHIK